MRSRRMCVVDEQLWEVDFWDTAGQERFDKLHGSYYFGADACILVFDVTRKITYKNLYVPRLQFLYHIIYRERWYRELREHCPFIPVICIANKIDTDLAVTNRHFTFAANNDIPIYFASASTGVNVVRAFNDSIKLAIEHKLDPKDEAMEQLISLVSSRHTLTKTS